MQKKFALTAIPLALLAAAYSNASDYLVYHDDQIYAVTRAAGANMTDNDGYLFATTESKIIRRQAVRPVGTVKLSRNIEDTLWVGQIEIGTSRRMRPRRHGQYFKAIFDTGSDFLWVTSSECREPGFSRKYHQRLSRTGRTLSIPFGVHYEDSSAEGKTYSDIVNVGGVKVRVSFGGVTKHVHFQSSTADGVFGLPLSAAPGIEQYNVFHAAKRKYPYFNPVAAFYFGTRGSELHLGQVKEVYSGRIEYHPVIPVDKILQSWVIGGGDIFVGEKRVVSGIQTLLDTGSSVIVGPPDAVKKIYRHISANDHFSTESTSLQYSIPCKSLPEVSFRWNDGTRWTILPEHFTIPTTDSVDESQCLGLFIGKVCSFGNPKTTWGLGDPFMQGKYIVFDDKNQRIGLAKAN